MAQFHFNGKLKYRGPKAYHFNQAIHGDETEHFLRHQDWNQGVRHLSEITKKEIELQTQLKKQNSEFIYLKPFNACVHMDLTGKRLKMNMIELPKIIKH